MAQGLLKDSPVYIDSQDISSLVYDIESYIVAYLDDNNIDHDKVLASQWVAALKYTYRMTFKRNKKALVASKACSTDYNIVVVSELADEYIYLCYKYIQRVCVEHFSYLSGISTSTLYSWKNDCRRLYIYNNSGSDCDGIENATITRMDVLKRLQQDTVTSATDLMLSRHTVDCITYFNAIQDRLGAGPAENQAVLDVPSLAAGLGISADVRLIGADSNKSN